MLYTELTKRAMQIAFNAHKRQKDKAGLPYIYHPYHLAEQMSDEVSICVALLHDVVEDTTISFKKLEAQGIPPMVIDTLKLLTHDKSTPYLDYIRKIKNSGNVVAIAVKLADLRHNSDTSRLNTNGQWIGGAFIESVDKKTSERLAKYKTAIGILEQSKADNVVYIEREIGTGWDSYSLCIGETYYCSSKNFTFYPCSDPYSEPIQTLDLISKESFVTTKDPSYKDITIVPGLKLDYPVCCGENPKPIANMRATFCSEPYGVAKYEYCIYDEDNANPRIFLDTRANAPIDPAAIEQLPVNDISVNIYPDESFVYDSRSIVEKRYIVSMHEKHYQWLHHIFHAFILQMFT